MNYIIYDFEVFKYDTLLGCVVVEKDSKSVFQTWDLNEIKEFYNSHQNDIWIGWNNYRYDDIILNTIINGKDPYKTSKKIIDESLRPRSNIPKYSYDLMAADKTSLSLKLTELIAGKNIHETEVDFDLDRCLTKDEKELTESYNLSDLKQTYYNFQKFYDTFKLRIEIIKEFNLPLSKYLKVTGTQLAEKVLKAERIEGIENQLIKPKLYDTLQLKNEDIKQFYLNEDFRKSIKKVIHVAGADITIGAGGLHSAIPKYHTNKALYIDVSGYYNLVMINYDLLPRSLNEEGKNLYEYMYHEQLKLKKINPIKRNVYKVILLAVFGAMNSEFSNFYDPQKGLLVTITGQIFMIDLLEKLDGLVKVIQTNTDGIMIEPYDWSKEKEIIGIVESWEERTGFRTKKYPIFNLYQRDVNCYIYQEEDGALTFKGEAVKNYDISDKAYAAKEIFNCKEPPIIAKGLVEYLLNKTSPEETVENHKLNMREFQYVCKKMTYDYTTYEETDYTGNTIVTRLQGINRVFAYKNRNTIGMVYKHKGKSKAKVSNLPPSVFVYDNEILSDEAKSYLCKLIDYNYYVKRIYERIDEFIQKPEEEPILLCFN